MIKSQYIGIDFDGTMVKHDYPNIGADIEGAIETVKELIAAGHKVILYTMRSGDRLVEAVEYLEECGIKFYAINENPSQKYWTNSPKIFFNILIDDISLGCPLVIPEKGRPYVDWERVGELLVDRGLLE